MAHIHSSAPLDLEFNSQYYHNVDVTPTTFLKGSRLHVVGNAFLLCDHHNTQLPIKSSTFYP